MKFPELRPQRRMTLLHMETLYRWIRGKTAHFFFPNSTFKKLAHFNQKIAHLEKILSTLRFLTHFVKKKNLQSNIDGQI